MTDKAALRAEAERLRAAFEATGAAWVDADVLQRQLDLASGGGSLAHLQAKAEPQAFRPAVRIGRETDFGDITHRYDGHITHVSIGNIAVYC